ncbi:hypothetical protein ACFX19_026761 [Malus domestica]
MANPVDTVSTAKAIQSAHQTPESNQSSIFCRSRSNSAPFRFGIDFSATAMSQVKRYKAGMENEKGIATTTVIALATTAKATASKPKSSLRSSGSRPRSLQKSQSDGIRSFVLKINQADKRRVFRQYFQLILTVTDEIEQRNREIKLYMNLSSENERWRSVPFTHPATFDTVVMNPELKNKIRSDLENFCVWRRSFLLYDPYGTEKKPASSPPWRGS